MSPFSHRTIELKVLLALTAAVLLAHLTVLIGTPMRQMLTPTELPGAFQIRFITPVPLIPPSTQQPIKQVFTQPLENKIAPLLGRETPTSSAVHDKTPDAFLTVATPGEAPATLDTPPDAPQPVRELAAAAVGATLPGSTRLKYQVLSNKFPYRLSAELRWQNSGESYDARLELSAFGLSRVQTSRGQITPQGLAPIRFSDKYRSEVAAHFNREQGKVTFSANTPDVPLLAGAQDRLSILLQLASMIAGGPNRYTANALIGMQTIGPRDADNWIFTVINEEKLSLPGGELMTLKLERNPRQEFDQKVELWMAPALGYLPARIKITESNGDFVDQRWLATEALQ